MGIDVYKRQGSILWLVCTYTEGVDKGHRGYGEKDIYQLCTLYRTDTTESSDGNSGCYYSGSCDRYDSKA